MPLPQHKKVAIFCETPFQFMLCLNAAVNCLGAEECIVFPVQEMYMSERKFTVEAQPPLIRHIYPVRRAQYAQTRWEGHLNHLRYGAGYILLDIMHAYPRHHDFTAAVGIRYTARCRQILKTLGMRVPYFMVEEGIGEYSWPRNREELCAATLPQYSDTLESLTHLCLLPELFRTMYPTETVCKAPSVVQGSTVCTLLQKQLLPGGAASIPLLPPAVYFHQPMDDRFDAANPSQKALEQAEETALRLLGEAVPDYQLKLHPRDPAQNYPPERVLQLDAAWEAVPALQNTERLLLVSENSTALISPKLLFDQEPKVVVLEELYPQHPERKEAHEGRMRLMRTVQGTYRNPARFRIPATFEELERDLRELAAME